MIGDGLFHLGCLLLVLVGVFLLSGAERGADVPRRLAGWGCPTTQANSAR